MVTLAILILFLVAALTLLYVYQHGHRSNLKKGRKPFQGMPQAGVLIKQATAAILILNII